MSRAKKTAKIRPGKRVAVSRVHFCHCFPLNVLYNLAEVNPAKAPIRTNKSNIPIMMLPRLAGDRNPTAAKTIRKKAQMISCMPVPTTTWKKKL
jgi:hypothetical protein